MPQQPNHAFCHVALLWGPPVTALNVVHLAALPPNERHKVIRGGDGECAAVNRVHVLDAKLFVREGDAGAGEGNGLYLELCPDNVRDRPSHAVAGDDELIANSGGIIVVVTVLVMMMICGVSL